MKMSTEINELATSLCKFQSEIKDAHKDSQAYNYKYADLGTVLSLIRPVMTSHGLSLAQFPVSDVDKIGVTSLLMHTSGQWIKETLYLPVDASNKMSAAQSGGSVLTYARRYSAAAILGITQVDDDAAMDQGSRQPKKPAEKAAPKGASNKQFADINEFVKAGKVAAEQLTWIQTAPNWENLTHSQATKILASLRKQEKAGDE
jgi:hypothetical protein